jgi:hypothetical protein
MQVEHRGRIRLGALVLGLSAFLLMLFPLIRPFFPLDVFDPERTLAAASPAFASLAWVVSHFLAMLGFVLLLGGMLALYAVHAGAEAEPRAFRGLVWGLGGVALVLPAFGVEAYTMPIIGELYLAGASGLAPVIPLTYQGPMTVVLLLGLLFPKGLNVAFAIRRSGAPVSAGFVFAIGSPCGCRSCRTCPILDGLLIRSGRDPARMEHVAEGPAIMSGRHQDRNQWKGLAAGMVAGLIGAWTMGQFHVLVTKLPGMPVESDKEEDSTVKTAAAISEGLFHHALAEEEKKVAGRCALVGAGVGGVYGAWPRSPRLAKAGESFNHGIMAGRTSSWYRPSALDPPSRRCPKRSRSWLLILCMAR